MDKRIQLTKVERFKIASSFGWKCVYCNTKVSFYPTRFGGSLAHIDHIKAVAKGGTNCKKNLVLSCQSCNLRKGTADNFGWKITITDIECDCEKCKFGDDKGWDDYD